MVSSTSTSAVGGQKGHASGLGAWVSSASSTPTSNLSSRQHPAIGHRHITVGSVGHRPVEHVCRVRWVSRQVSMIGPLAVCGRKRLVYRGLSSVSQTHLNTSGFPQYKGPRGKVLSEHFVFFYLHFALMSLTLLPHPSPFQQLALTSVPVSLEVLTALGCLIC